jgi:flavin-dependent dehydrogenase
VNNKDIHIVGAGPAGLSAAINLRREGYNVIVHETEKEIGGPPSWHPSIHCTPIDFDVFEKYTGLDVRPAFKDCTNYLKYYDGEEEKPFSDFIGTIPNMYCVIRGPHEASLDNYLYQMALKEGVEVKFNDKWTGPDFKSAPEKTIIATGFGQSAYEDLGMKFTPFYGYWTRTECPPDEVHISIYEGDFTNEYGYSGSKDGIWYSLIFAKGDIDQAGLDKFSAILKEKTGVEVKKWGRFTGTTTRYAKLFNGNFIFAGTASGLIEPAQGYGIVAAMLGGKIAATAVTNPEVAQAEYNKFIEPIGKHIALKFKPGYRSSIHYRMGQVWFDIPTIKPRVPDYELK